VGRATGIALTTFHAAVDKGIVLNSWDKMVVPLPFARVLVRVGKLIYVPPDADDEEMARYAAELQATLDRVCEFSEENVSEVGGGEFPSYSRSKRHCRFQIDHYRLKNRRKRGSPGTCTSKICNLKFFPTPASPQILIPIFLPVPVHDRRCIFALAFSSM